MNVYLDESGGFDRGHLAVAGVAFPRDADRDAAEREWPRSAKKGRKWDREQFVRMVRFLAQHGGIATGCHVRLTDDLRSAVKRRMKDSAAMGIHMSHGSEKPLKEFVWLWQQVVATAVDRLLAFIVTAGVVIEDLHVHPDPRTMAAWQRAVMRDALARLDGPDYARHIEMIAGKDMSEEERRKLRATCRWRSPRWDDQSRRSRLLDVADGYCSLYVTGMDDEGEATAIFAEGSGRAVPRITTDVTSIVMQRASLSWERSATTFSFPDHPPEVLGYS